ncbi:hypothetical protein EYF80_048236 [Liparis tanakae]|uniref:Uncharacterized protein n=1 Tax=Liparis tanakae TaxID=230148 RepID=A0A4Z2FLG4_9TELE|nr:hypothetical protein EYF80_048236 [Liparis tanakae]
MHHGPVPFFCRCPLPRLLFAHFAAAPRACGPAADLHSPSVPKRADVSLRQPPRSDALLRQLEAAQERSLMRVHILTPEPSIPFLSSDLEGSAVFHLQGGNNTPSSTFSSDY